MMQIPNGRKALAAFTCMDRTFKLIGDVQPNKSRNHAYNISFYVLHFPLHLFLAQQDLFKEFQEYCELFHLDCLDISGFCEVWQLCFPHVVIREYKAVTGKCSCCGELSVLRSSFRDSNRPLEVTRLHAFHRATYMGERAFYYKRQDEALTNPAKFYSIITDGMAQTHTIIP